MLYLFNSTIWKYIYAKRIPGKQTNITNGSGSEVFRWAVVRRFSFLWAGDSSYDMMMIT